MAASIALLAAQPIHAQAQRSQPAPQARAAAIPLPDALALTKILLSTMAAIDHANKTGNYSVLLALGSDGFQAGNSQASLGAVFADIRSRRVDLADTLVIAPSYEFAPALVAPGLLRMRGQFPLRPNAIGFDLIYQWDAGWRLHGVSIATLGPAR